MKNEEDTNTTKIEKIRIGKATFNRIRVGERYDLYENSHMDMRCRGCGSHKGTYHEFGCDSETCPRCLGQISNCACDGIELVGLDF